jgi:hypothetical protein
MKSNYDRSVSLICSVCGENQFEYDETLDDAPVTCVKCEKVFSRDELIADNDEAIQSELDAVKKEVLADMTKDLKKAFKSWK